MSREKATYRQHLAALRELFPDRELITLTEAAEYCGKDYRTLKSRKDFPLRKSGRGYLVSCINLASWLAC